MALCLVAGLATSAVSAQGQGLWARVPTADDFRAFFPDGTEMPADGEAILRCAVLRDGALANCVVISETPARAGFGKVALTLAPKFRASPEGIRKMRGVATIPVRFRNQGPPGS